MAPVPSLRKSSRARHSLGVAMLGGNPKLKRKDHDFYATLDDVFLAVYPILDLGPDVHEFCCGDGAICKLLEERGHNVVATDLHDRGWGTPGRDALAMEGLSAPDLVTNPPFNIAPRLIEHIMPMRPRVFALLLKSTFWHAKSRMATFRRYPPSGVYALSWRPDFEKLDRPTLEMSWVVWDSRRTGPTVYDVLERPAGYAEAERVERAARREARKLAELAAAAVAGPGAPARRARRPRPRLQLV